VREREREEKNRPSDWEVYSKPRFDTSREPIQEKPWTKKKMTTRRRRMN
jgi:hypothetical protein